MSQKLVQTQALAQTQNILPQQLMMVHLLELPLSLLEERVKNELVDNAALEEGRGEDEQAETKDEDAFEDSENDMAEYAESFTEGADKDALADYRDIDDVPDYLLRQTSAASTKREEIPLTEGVSFYQQLEEQIMERSLTDRQRELIEYIIGSLDDGGLLRKKLWTLVDELALYQGIETTEDELLEMLYVLQDFEPRGIGARSMEECLLLQLNSPDYTSEFKEAEIKIISKSFEDFTHKRWDKIKKRLQLSDDDFEHILSDLKRLNPRPGSALTEDTGADGIAVIPDFYAEQSDEGDIEVGINCGEVPTLHVSRAFIDSMEQYSKNRKAMGKAEKDALVYTKGKIDAARGFISAIEQRQNTLLAVIKAIVEIQQKYFEEGDVAALKPMKLQDVAQRTQLDISTVSRACNGKYVQTVFGILPMKFFFNEKIVSADGSEHSTMKIKERIKSYIETEDKKIPLSDDAMAELLKKEGFPVARRTVAKYREQMGLPVARLRR